MTGRAYVLLLSCALSISGCVPFLYDDSCGPEFRRTVVRGDLRNAAGGRIGQASLTLSEVRGDSLTRSLELVVMGIAHAGPGPLSGRVTTVRLLAKTDVLRELAFEAGNEHEIIRIPAEAMLQAPFDALKQRAIAGELVLELETTLEGNTRLLTPLALQYAGDWDRAHCS